MRDETLDPRALSIPANSMAIYPAPTTATFLKKKKKKKIYIYIYIYIGSLQVDYRVEQCSIR